MKLIQISEIISQINDKTPFALSFYGVKDSLSFSGESVIDDIKFKYSNRFMPYDDTNQLVSPLLQFQFNWLKYYNKNKFNFETKWFALASEYDPIENYNRTETNTETRTGGHSIQKSSESGTSQNNTQTIQKATNNSHSYGEDGVKQVYTGGETTTDSYTNYTESETENGSYTDSTQHGKTITHGSSPDSNDEFYSRDKEAEGGTTVTTHTPTAYTKDKTISGTHKQTTVYGEPGSIVNVDKEIKTVGTEKDDTTESGNIGTTSQIATTGQEGETFNYNNETTTTSNHTTGNIGVTTSQQMIAQTLEVYKANLINEYILGFVKEYTFIV